MSDSVPCPRGYVPHPVGQAAVLVNKHLKTFAITIPDEAVQRNVFDAINEMSHLCGIDFCVDNVVVGRSLWVMPM